MPEALQRAFLRPALVVFAVGGLWVAACTTAPTASGPATGTASPAASGTMATGAPSASSTPAATPPASAPPGGSPAGGTPSGSATASSTAEPVASTASIPTSALPKARFTFGGKTIVLPIEVISEKEFPIGLSGRRSLEGRGMLFAFPDGAKTGFWMKNTHIDLDIAFVDASMKVIDIQTMKADTLDEHRPATSYVAAIEAPAGWYAANGVQRDATVALDVDLRAAAAGR